MYLRKLRRHGRENGHALTFTIIFTAIALLILGATMSRLATTAKLIDRNNQYFACLAAAEAATEKVISEIADDYQKVNASHVHTKMPTYRSRRPLSSDHPHWGNFKFNNGQGTDDATSVEQITPWGISPLISQYAGLSGFASTFRIVSNARELNGRENVVGAVQQDFQIATIPIFQFAIFYNIDLEINPGPDMTVRGRVHSNKDLFSRPGGTLTFNGDVTAAGNLYNHRKPGDPTPPANGGVVFNGENDGGVNSLNLPLGVENTPENVRQILERPPVSEGPNSNLGRERFFNKADLVVSVYDDHVEVRGGTANGNGPNIGWGTASAFISTNQTFFNKRENKFVRAVQIDVGAFTAWNNGPHNPLRIALGRDINQIWVEDLRTQTIDSEPGVRLVNGQTLPPGGLTVATPDPLYVKGHYNAPSGAVGTSNTSNTKPAALIADSITVLSGNWNDANSTKSLGSRVAANTTVNAAFMAGIVPTVQGSYSGGVENFPRFLEDWASRTFTYNGSMIVMFPSRIATGTWKGTGSSYGIYNPPVRNWYFDLNFLDPTKLPPGTPEVRTVIRGQWQIVSPGPASS
jgi:hypothetical protein